jgi:hypothetical protein
LSQEPVTVTVTGIVCETALLVAETLTVYVPELAPLPVVTVRVEFAFPPEESVTDPGLMEQDKDELHDSVTVPANPVWLARLSFVVAEPPELMLSVSGLVEREKSGEGPEGP